MQTKTPAILALSLLIGVALAGCNRDQPDTTATIEPTPAPVDVTPAPVEPEPATEPAPQYTVDKLAIGGEGDKTYLTDSKGRRLYVLEGDDTAAKCVGDCLKSWHAVVGPVPAIDIPDITPTSITTVTRADGTPQLAYYGHPLYYYDDGTPQLGEVTVVAPDESPWGRWYLVNAKGETVALKEGVPTAASPTAAGADGRELPTQSPGGQPGEKN